jgi:hypothetical protein
MKKNVVARQDGIERGKYFVRATKDAWLVLVREWRGRFSRIRGESPADDAKWWESEMELGQLCKCGVEKNEEKMNKGENAQIKMTLVSAKPYILSSVCDSKKEDW